MDAAEKSQMKLMTIRRERLTEWFANKTLPRKEKSTLSQLIRGNEVFGPRIARRLERDYGMPRGHLDGIDKAEMQSFGDRIRTLRKERDLTQLQLAEYVGVTQTAVAAWESGKREVPKGDNLLKLAEALGFEAGELMATHVSRKEASEEVHLLAAFRSLPKERQLIAIKLVEALK